MIVRGKQGLIAAGRPLRVLLVLMLLMLVTSIAFVAKTGADAPSGGAANPNTYNLLAEGDSLESVVATPLLPVVTQIAASPYGASASLSSLGQSMADAGAPYSPVVYSLPATVGGLALNQLPPLPPLPGYVSSTYPTIPSDVQTQAGYQLTAVTSAQDAKGGVSVGSQLPGVNNGTLFANAETSANADGSVSASATAGIDLLNLGGIADIGNISSTESMTEQAGSAPIVTGSTNLGTVTLLGKVSGLIGSTLNVFGVGIPLSLTTSNLSAFNSLLSLAGVTLTYLPQTFVYIDGSSSTGPSPNTSKTIQSVDSGGIQVSISQSLSGEPVTVTETLGRAYVSATDVSNSDSGSAGESSTTPGSEFPVATTGTDDGGATSGLGLTLPPAPTSSTPQGSSVSATPPTSSGTALVSRLNKGPSGESFYLMLVLAGIVLFACSQLTRFAAVRLTLRKNNR